MPSTGERRHLLRRVRLGIAALAILAVLASPALASGAFFGNATVRPADHGSGRTLSGQGIEIHAEGRDAGTTGGAIVIPINSLDLRASTPSAGSAARLSFVRGDDSVTVSRPRFDLSKGTFEGTVERRRLVVFRLGSAVNIDPRAGSVLFVNRRLQLTGTMAKLLQGRLDLERPLITRGVGQASMGASETTPATCTPVTISPPYNRPPPPPEDCVGSPSPEVPPPPSP